MADVVTLGSRCEQHIAAGSIDRLSCGADILDYKTASTALV